MSREDLEAVPSARTERRISVFNSAAGEAEYLEAYDSALKHWPVPFEEFFVPTRFGETHLIAGGPKEADPLILLHPSGSSSTIWCRNVAPLGEYYRTFAIDTIGEPNKSVLYREIDGRHQCQDFADWMVDLLDCLKIKSTHVVGNSFGGFLALNTVLYLPERVRKCVLISPAATFLQMWPWYWHFVVAGIVDSLTGSRRMFLRAYDWIWQGFPIEGYVARLRTISATVGHPRHSFPTVFADDKLRKIRTPILLLIGDHEVIYEPERVIEKATRLVSGLRAEMVPNANHNAEYTAADAVNEKILAFLAE